MLPRQCAEPRERQGQAHILPRACNQGSAAGALSGRWGWRGALGKLGDRCSPSSTEVSLRTKQPARFLAHTPLPEEPTLMSSALPAGVPEASNEFLCQVWGS